MSLESLIHPGKLFGPIPKIVMVDKDPEFDLPGTHHALISDETIDAQAAWEAAHPASTPKDEGDRPVAPVIPIR